MKHVYRKLIVAFLFALILVRSAAATVGLGVGPANTNLDIKAGRDYIVYIILYNPSDNDVNVTVVPSCIKCSGDLNFLGKKIGTINYNVELAVEPSFLNIEKNTSFFDGKQVAIRIRVPLINKQHVRLNAFGKNFTFTYYWFLFDTKSLKARVTANTLTTTKVSVVSDFNLSVQGISSAVFLFTAASTILILSASFFLFVLKKEKELKKFFRGH